MTNHMSWKLTFFLLVWPTIWSYIYVQIDMWPPYDQYDVTYMPNSLFDHYITNSWSTIWPIPHLTIMWPTHFWSMHMTNDIAKIVISTNLIICGGLNIKCKWFILRVVYLYCPSPVKPPNNNSQPHYPFKMDFGPPLDSLSTNPFLPPPPPTNTFQRASRYRCLPLWRPQLLFILEFWGPCRPLHCIPPDMLQSLSPFL